MADVSFQMKNGRLKHFDLCDNTHDSPFTELKKCSKQTEIQMGFSSFCRVHWPVRKTEKHIVRKHEQNTETK